MSVTEKFSKPYRLSKVELEQKEPEPQAEQQYFVFPRYVSQLKKLGLPIIPEIQDYQLTRFMNEVDEDLGIEKTVTMILRRQGVDYISDKKPKPRGEFIVFYETWFGKKMVDNQVYEIPPVTDFPNGLDKQVTLRPPKYDNRGNKLEAQIASTYWIFTIPYSPETIDEILEKSVYRDGYVTQFSVKGSRGWGGWTLEEFRDLSFAELEERGKKGLTGIGISKKK